MATLKLPVCFSDINYTAVLYMYNTYTSASFGKPFRLINRNNGNVHTSTVGKLLCRMNFSIKADAFIT